jgi:hypothetical protein
MSEKTSAEIYATMKRNVSQYDSRYELYDEIDALLAAKEREVRAEFAGPMPDPAKADVCANCGALQWDFHCVALDFDHIYSPRFCRHCGVQESINTKTHRWTVDYPGKGAEVTE